MKARMKGIVTGQQSNLASAVGDAAMARFR
jgi:hypothetical protein